MIGSGFGRRVRELRALIAAPLDREAARKRILDGVAARERTFLESVRRLIYSNPRSPYRALLDHAGLDAPGLEALVREHGLDGALHRLFEAGVFIELGRLKRGGTIERGSLRLEVVPSDFDNPMLCGGARFESSGSSGARSTVMPSLGYAAIDAPYIRLYLESMGLIGRPLGLWRGVPPVGSGINYVLRLAACGLHAERWFAQNRSPWTRDGLRNRAALWEWVLGSRAAGVRFPVPRFVAQDGAREIALWLERCRARGQPASLDTNASSGVRICVAAERAGLDISGTVLRLGGEPYTPAKQRVLERAGARGVCHYSGAELGQAAVACAEGEVSDEAHVLTGKFALIQRERRVRGGERTYAGLFCTTVSDAAPKIMLNVELGDHAVLEHRECGCELGRLGLTLRVRDIGSYDKLTSEGMNYQADELRVLLEETLPARFGGHPGDYQLVETDAGGIPRVALVVSPDVGEVDERLLVEAVYRGLGESGDRALMVGFWRDAGTVRIERRPPHRTRTTKVPLVHVVHPLERN